MKRVLLVPHGQTPWNAAGRFQGHTDVGMNSHGMEQAERLAQSLRGEKIAAIISSDLQRASQTAAIIAGVADMPVRIDARLRELNFGTWEGLTGKEIAASDPAGWERWEAGQIADFPEGESLRQFADRLGSFYADATLSHEAGSDGALMFVAHRGALRVMICLALGFEPIKFRQFHLDQTSVTELRILRYETVLQRLNDTHHLRDLLSAR